MTSRLDKIIYLAKQIYNNDPQDILDSSIYRDIRNPNNFHRHENKDTLHKFSTQKNSV